MAHETTSKPLARSLITALLTVLIGAGAAVTYYYFEHVVSRSLSYVWDDVFATASHRWLVIPICLLITLAYFGAQHLLDPASEQQESHGLGSAPTPTVSNFLKVLGIGFLSLFAGASLGPEAILVPACIMLGSYLGIKLLDDSAETAKVFGMAGFVALCAAFFNSFLVGLLALLLIKKQLKAKITLKFIILAAIASGSTVFTLGLLSSSAYVKLPHYTWSLDIRSLLVLAILAVAGYGLTYLLGTAHNLSEAVAKRSAAKAWWLRGLVAAIGLSVLYLLGGPLVEFTGNESVIPMLKQSADLGLLGLVWILIIKLLAIGWSKASGYRGGLVFPTIFMASVVVAIAQIFATNVNLIYGLIVVLVGAIAADRKVKVLF